MQSSSVIQPVGSTQSSSGSSTVFTAAWIVSVMLSFGTNFTLRETGVVDSVSLWGWLWLVPMLLVDRRLATARRIAQQRAVARIEADSAAKD